MRALSSLVLLAGFYLVALIELLAAFALIVWLVDLSHGLFAASLGKPVIVLLVGGVGMGLWKAVRAKDAPVEGLRVDERDAPELWETVRELAAEVRTRAPQEIVLVAEVNASVREQSRLLGLVGGRRTLSVGIPLLLGLRVDQMRSVLAHELGHYSGKHTRFAGAAYRGRLALAHALADVSNLNIAAWPLKLYARLYLLVDNAVVRRQELEADRASIRLAGRDAAASALRELPVLDAAWSFYFDAYIEGGWQAGNVPDDLFGGFAELLAARREELRELRAAEPDMTPSRWDTHPPVGVRIQTIMAMPEDDGTDDDRPATDLLADPAETHRRAQQEILPSAGRAVLPWPDFTHTAITAQMQERADRVFRSVARTAGIDRPGLPEVLDLVEQGRLADLAQQLFPESPGEELSARFAALFLLMFELAAIGSGVLRWRHSWSAPAELLTPDGRELDLGPLAELAVTEPAKARAALAELGVETETAAVQRHTVSAAGGEVLAGIANVKVDGVDHDLLVLSPGLLFLPDPGSKDKGKKRLRGLVENTSPAHLADLGTFLAYEELSTTEVHRAVPVKATLVHHTGRRIELAERLTSETLTSESQEVLVEILNRLRHS